MIFSNIKMNILLSILLLLSACHSHEPGDGHDHGHDHGTTTHPPPPDHHNGHEDHSKDESIILNQAQYTNASIDTGWFEMKNLNEVIHANGYTKLDPQDQAEVSMPVSGTIQSIHVIEGDYVRKGTTLATMLSLEYNRLLLDKAELEEEISVEQAQIPYLQEAYDRAKILTAEGINAEADLQKVRTDLHTKQAKISAIAKQVDLLNQTIQLIGYSDSPTLSIKAPINGYITEVMLKIGTITQAGDLMFSIVDNSQMHVDLLVYEKDLSKVRKGQKVRFILTNQSNKEIEGKIYNIGKSFENDTKTVAVHADIKENDAKLIPGMYVNALIDVGDNKVQSLPTDAVVMAEGRHFIFLLEKENEHHAHDGPHDHSHAHDAKDEIRFTRLEVKTGPINLGYIAVTPLGLIPKGDRIVTKGAYYIQSHLQKSEGAGGHSH